ncbi:meiosis inhibitor protein 1-like isoform X6 [Silurus meridionalis]|nr:meiosis inhibitor protein 1-like isoform X6 [Silurus meridionalis]
MLRLEETVCFLMNPGEETQQPELQHCSLPLILKRLLLTSDELLQVASVQCVCAVLKHSTQYCTSFILDNIPEFMFERLSSSNDVLLWCVYNCVLLLCEDSLFFSQCHSVYGIESLVRSLKASLKLSNLEVPKQGLQLLTVILEKQPAGVRLFPILPAFVGVAEVVTGGLSSPCLRVATHAARVATALMKMHHQSMPVHYRELKKIVEALSCRFRELPTRAISQRRRCSTDSESRSHGAFLMQALICFHETCRLVEQCVSEASVKDSSSTAGQENENDTLECVCLCLLKCCDTVYIPTVTRVCELSPSPRVLQLFFSILSVQFSLSPLLIAAFANKLVSSGFIRLTVENKALLCSGNRHTSLNEACCRFILKLCAFLLSQPDPHTCYQHLSVCVEEVECVLRECLPSLYYHVCDWPCVLGEVTEANLRTQYCLLHLLYLSWIHGDRMLPDATVFSSVVEFISAAVEHCDALPPSVLHSVLYLLSETQENSSDLDRPSVKIIIKVLSSTHLSSSPLSIPHPSLLHFIFRYPELAELFGATVLSRWLRRGKELTGKALDPDQRVLMKLLEKNHSVLLTMLGVLFEEEQEEVAECAVNAIQSFLMVQQNCSSVSQSLLKPSVLQILQKLNCDSNTVVHGVCVMLEVLCVLQTNSTVHTNMDHTDFKLLYHISNLVGKTKCSKTEYLLPALNYLYCCVSLSPTHTADRVVSMLLCNTGLMELLQTLLDVFQSSSSSSSSSSVICCSMLLLSSIITLQHTQSAQVHKSVCVDFDSMVRTLLFWKRHTDSLLLACTVRLLKAVLDVDLCSAVVCVSECMEFHPLSYRGAISITTALQSVLLQKQEMLLGVSVNCLNSLINFLNRGRAAIVQHVVCQPWNRFLLHSLLNSDENLTLHPATLCLLTVLVRWSGDGVQWESDLVYVCETAEKKGVKELQENTIHTLKQLLTECSECSLSEELKLRVESLLDHLESLTHLCLSEISTGCLLRVGRLSICLNDFTVNH